MRSLHSLIGVKSVGQGLLLLLVLLTFQACGGGGGGNNIDSLSTAPSITVTPTTLNFSTQYGGTLPSDQYIDASTTATDAFYAGVAIPAGQTLPSWLSVDLASQGTGSASFRVSINQTTLTPGTYSQVLQVGFARADQSIIAYRNVTVNYTVTDNITVTPLSLSFTQLIGNANAAEQTLSLSGSVGGTSTWDSNVIYNTTSNWLTVTPNTGNTLPSTVSVKVDPNLPAGTYTATININSGAKVTQIPVTYTVREPTISTPQSSIAFAAGNGQLSLPAASTLMLTSESGNNIDFTTSIAYNSGASDWLSVTGTSAPGNLTLAPNTVNLAEGVYTATVTLTPLNGAGSISIDVSYTVHATTINISQSSATFEAFSGQTNLPAAIDIQVNTEANSNVNYTSSVDYTSGTPGWLTPANGTAPNTLSLQPNTTNLAPGTYTAIVSLVPESGAGTVTITINYKLDASTLSLGSQSASFTIDPASDATPANLDRSLTTASTGTALTWTASSSEPWLSVTANGNSGDSVTLSLIPTELEKLTNGTFSATVTFTYNGPYVIDAIVQLPVTLSLSLPRVNYVAPYVAMPNTSKEVIIRGEGFTNAVGTVDFGSNAVSVFTVLSDTEIRVTHPALAEGHYPVHVTSKLGIDHTRAELLVKAPITYKYTVLPTSLVRDRTLFDAERVAIYTNNFSAQYGGPTGVPRIERHHFANGSWTTDSLLLNGPPYDIAMTPDGKEIIALSPQTLYHIDLDTWKITYQVDLSSVGSYTNFSKIAMSNDGNALVYVGSSWITMFRYNVLTKTFELVPGYAYNLYGSIPPVASQDGSRILVGQNGITGPLPFYYFDTSTSQFVQALPDLTAGRMAYDRTGTNALIDGYVYNRSFQPLGLETALILGVISPDGTLVYGFTPSTITVGGVLHTYDITQPTSTGGFTEIGTGITIADDPGSYENVAITNDGGAVIISGYSNLIIQPVP